VRQAPLVERLLRRERVITAGALGVLCALAWFYLLNGAGFGATAWDLTRLSQPFLHHAPGAISGMDMPGMDMGGMTAGDVDAHPQAWSAGLWALGVAMWWTMMVAMMVPSAAPTILLFGQVQRRALAQGQSAALTPIGIFAAGYLLVWLGFSLLAVLAQWALQQNGLISPAGMGSRSRWLSASVLIGAGLYQLSPFQNLCLSHCRSPAAFLSRYWRPGAWGALRLGVLHGAYCVGCCWMLMALLFVGGVMNLAWIAGLTLLVMAQKLLPGGRWIARACGTALLAWGAAVVFLES
jgi:predicted metal-binding membrane protein